MFRLEFLSRTLQDSYVGDNERCLRLCRGEDPNLIPSLSNVARPATCPSDCHVGGTNVCICISFSHLRVLIRIAILRTTVSGSLHSRQEL